MRATAAPQLLANHTCRTAQEVGWKSVKNGELLTLAEAQFDLFITSDQGLAYQENLRGRRIAILELSTNKLRPIEARQRNYEMPSRKYRAPSSVASKSLSDAKFWVARAPPRLGDGVAPSRTSLRSFTA